ncbi:hypothetical protein [Candidatus Pyrohabitans sp.]
MSFAVAWESSTSPSMLLGEWSAWAWEMKLVPFARLGSRYSLSPAMLISMPLPSFKIAATSSL